jgi:ubiquitin conjugation factor E4 B
VRHPAWCPGGGAGAAARASRAGRALERTSLLGPFLAVSALPDVFDSGAAPPVEELFASHRRGDVAAAQATLRALALQLQEGVYGVVMALLRHKDPSREAVIAFLARMVNANAERGKMQINPEACASHGACAAPPAVPAHARSWGAHLRPRASHFGPTAHALSTRSPRAQARS